MAMPENFMAKMFAKKFFRSVLVSFLRFCEFSLRLHRILVAFILAPGFLGSHFSPYPIWFLDKAITRFGQSWISVFFCGIATLF